MKAQRVRKTKTLCDWRSFPSRVTVSYHKSPHLFNDGDSPQGQLISFFFFFFKEDKSRGKKAAPTAVWAEGRSHAEISHGEPPSKGKTVKKT